MRTDIALAAGMCLVLAAGPAVAQNPTYEGRGYGGPLYVGPNFEQGGQHRPPVYGKKPIKKSVTVTRERVAPPKVQKVAPEKEDATEKAPEPAEKPATSAVAEKPVETEATKAETAATTPATCKRFDPTAGQTITVPCQ